jgi:hypothetical protein
MIGVFLSGRIPTTNIAAGTRVSLFIRFLSRDQASRCSSTTTLLRKGNNGDLQVKPPATLLSADRWSQFIGALCYQRFRAGQQQFGRASSFIERKQ